MPRLSIEQRIKYRIDISKPGTFFLFSDFEDISKSSKVGTALTAFERQGIILRVIRGIYEKPRYDYKKEYRPAKGNLVAKAISKNFGWVTFPSEDTAIYMIGLTEKRPKEWVYISSGATVEYDYRGVKIKFKHSTNQRIYNYSQSTGLMIETLKAIGRDNIDLEMIAILSKLLSRSEKHIILKEANNINSWIFEYLKLICMCE